MKIKCGKSEVQVSIDNKIDSYKEIVEYAKIVKDMERQRLREVAKALQAQKQHIMIS